jgi:tryptophan-rich sensory protein
VFVYQDGKVALRRVTLGTSDGADRRVLSGIDDGETVRAGAQLDVAQDDVRATRAIRCHELDPPGDRAGGADNVDRAARGFGACGGRGLDRGGDDRVIVHDGQANRVHACIIAGDRLRSIAEFHAFEVELMARGSSMFERFRMPSSQRRSVTSEVIAFTAPLAIGALGSIPTAASIPTWYRTLENPSWNPPSRVFGPVWTTLYGMMGLALVLVRRQPAAPATGRAQAVFGLQLALNLAWSFVFFGARSPRGALAVIVMLWAAILATIATFGRVRRSAALLLVPYLGWVTFASILNAEIARRNAG